MAVSLTLKNFCLFVILLLLAQMVSKLGFNYGGGGVDSQVVALEFQRQIAEVHKFLKITRTMLQVQVDDVDRKLESQVSGLGKRLDDESGKLVRLRSELGKRMDDETGKLVRLRSQLGKRMDDESGKLVTLRSELGKRMDDETGKFNKLFNEMDMRVGGLEGVLNGNEWLTTQEFDKFVEEFERMKGREIGLDEIRAIAKGVAEKTIARHAADGLGRVDYAVASGGASVVKHSEPYFGARGVSRVIEWFKGGSVRGDSVKVLQPSFGQLGECFPLKGESGFVEIKLWTAIVPEAITLEHVDKSVAFDRSSAPKDCKVLGWLRNQENTEKEHLVAEFTYDLEKNSAQTFNVLDSKGSDPTIIDTLRLEFMSNHGSPAHTCIYRVRVHGHQPNVDV